MCVHYLDYSSVYGCICCLAAKLCLTLQSHELQPTRLLCPWISQARILEWVAISFSRGSSGPRDQTQVSCFASRFFTNLAMREAQFGLFTPVCLSSSVTQQKSRSVSMKQQHTKTSESAKGVTRKEKIAGRSCSLLKCLMVGKMGEHQSAERMPLDGVQLSRNGMY